MISVNIGFLKKMVENDSDAASKLANYSDGILFEIDVLEKKNEKKYKHLVFEAMDKIVDKCGDLTFRVFQNSPDIIREANGELDVEYILINSRG